MTAELKYTATIDPDALVSELIESWVNGNHSTVIHQLATDHPALVALMIVQGAQDKTLTLSDCNSIANRLSDHRLELCDSLWVD